MEGGLCRAEQVSGPLHIDLDEAHAHRIHETLLALPPLPGRRTETVSGACA